MAAITYKDAGVDRDKADKLVEKISGLTKKTLNKRVKSSVGGYASLYEINKKLWIAASTDGVGTKLKLAFDLDKHDTVGQDLVAMSVNDLICVGATPLFFLDYFATGKLESGTAEQVIAGIAQACSKSACALVGGETAEMPDFYSKGEYDLGGFAVGMLDPKKVLPKRVPVGTRLIGVASSGIHSNGFSLIRRLLAQVADLTERERLMRECLTPTKLYAKSILPLVEKGWLLGAAHVTGSGFLNVPRISAQVSYRMELPSIDEVAPVFKWVREASRLPFEELAQTFNMGVGMVLAVPPKFESKVLASLKRSGEKAWSLGETIKKKGESSVTLSERALDGATQSIVLS